MTLYCPDAECANVAFDDAEFMCERHNLDLVAEPPASRQRPATAPPSPGNDPRPAPPAPAPPAPAPPGSGRAWSTATCWSCQAPSPNAGNTRCLECPETLIPPRLLLRWDSGMVKLDPGESVQLGREGSYAGLFREHINVGRAHATVGVDPDGTVWITPMTTRNGTFRPADTDDELLPGRRYDLRDGETLRFARDMRAAVAVYALPGT